MTKKKQISCGAKSIVLTDEQMVDEINELLAKSDYNYNFNKLANVDNSQGNRQKKEKIVDKKFK